MKLAATLDVYGGGVGSGCHGPNCGRKSGAGKEHVPKSNTMPAKPLSELSRRERKLQYNEKIRQKNNARYKDMGEHPEKYVHLKHPSTQTPSRIAQMDEYTWVSKDGTSNRVQTMTNHHLTSVLRQLHEQLALAQGNAASTGQNMSYKNRAAGEEGKVIERAIRPYRAMVWEAKKRGLNW